MLKLIDYRTKSKGLPDLLPYALLAVPGVNPQQRRLLSRCLGDTRTRHGFQCPR